MFFPKQITGRSFEIHKDHPGSLPRQLEGTYTSKHDAEKAIQGFHAMVRSRAKPVGKAKRDLKAAQLKAKENG